MEPEALLNALVTVVTMVLSTCVHEYAHALAAYRLGDDYAARLGRLSLNPLVHADPIGTVLIPALGALAWGGGFGWGRPVPYIPNNLTRKFSMRAGEAMIAFAGPFANLVMATLSAGLWVALRRYGVIGHASPIDSLLGAMVQLNFALFFFNLIPMPPLDGSKIAAFLFGRKADPVLDALSGAGMLGVMLAIAFGGYLISKPVSLMMHWSIQGFSYILP